MRGEYKPSNNHSIVSMELPPRARRIPVLFQKIGTVTGTTSACAENTRRAGLTPRQNRNYLRVRGEYSLVRRSVARIRELPPRARRIRSRVCSPHSRVGTTSACAENTAGFRRGVASRWNYLRVRGEYRSSHFFHASVVELPPRARRIPDRQNFGWQTMGTTSACAENTPRPRPKYP